MDFEKLFEKALSNEVDNVGGSIESALDTFDIYDESQRQEIKKWFGWEPELPEVVNLNINDLDYEDGDDLDEKIGDYLSDTYGYCVNGFCIFYMNTTTGEIVVNEIDWDTSE